MTVAGQNAIIIPAKFVLGTATNYTIFSHRIKVQFRVAISFQNTADSTRWAKNKSFACPALLEPQLMVMLRLVVRNVINRRGLGRSC